MTKSTLVASITCLAFPTCIFAQAPNSFQPPAGGATANTNNNRTEDTHTTDSSRKPDSPYGKEIPLFDTQNESFEFMGSEFSMQDNRFADQFSGYLVQSQEKIEDAAKYRATLREIIDTLDRSTKGSPKSKLSKGYKLLGVAAEYPADSGICESLQNALALAQLSMNKSRRTDADIAEMRKKHAALARKMEFIESKTQLDPAESSAPGGGKSKKGAQPTSIKWQENTRQRMELLLLVKKSEITGNISAKLAKIQYQAMLVQLFMQRRFEHVVIGCRFYNLVFTDGESKLNINKGSDMYKFFADTLGVQPTIAGLDSAANDLIGKAKRSADSVRNHLQRGQVHQGTQRMVEAFAIGEHLTPIHTFSPELRNKMHQYILDSKQLKDAAKVKNWQEAERYTQKLRDQASDFRYIMAITAISAYKRASDFEITAFYGAKQQRNDDKAGNHMSNAIEFWPTNPRIEEANKLGISHIHKSMKNLDLLEVKATEFKSIVRSEDFSSLSIKDASIYEEYFRQASSNTDLSEIQRDDYNKLHKLANDISSGLIKIEKAVEKADALAAESQYYAAWETVEIERNNDHLDKKRITDKVNELAGRASRFRELFDDANEMVDGKNYGSALSCYLEAKSLFPKSVLAERGIKGMLKLRESDL